MLSDYILKGMAGFKYMEGPIPFIQGLLVIVDPQTVDQCTITQTCFVIPISTYLCILQKQFIVHIRVARFSVKPYFYSIFNLTISQQKKAVLFSAGCQEQQPKNAQDFRQSSDQLL